MTNQKFSDLFGIPSRKEDSKAEQIHYDIAASAQLVLEKILLNMTNHVHEKTGMKNLCLGGGVALNGVENYKILKDGLFALDRFSEIEDILKQILKNDSDNIEVVASLSEIYSHRGEDIEAIELIDSALEQDPTSLIVKSLL